MSKKVVEFFGSVMSSGSSKIANEPEPVPADYTQYYPIAGTEWVECHTEDGCVYYFNTQTEITQWEYPFVEETYTNYEWEEHYTEEGEVYYYNTVTQSTQWEYPYSTDNNNNNYDYNTVESEWMEYYSEDGYPYYYNVYSGLVQWEYPYAITSTAYDSYDYSSSAIQDYAIDIQYHTTSATSNSNLNDNDALYATESSTDRHLEIWARFFENAFAAQEAAEEDRRNSKPSKRSKAQNRAEAAAKLEKVVNKWPPPLPDKKFRTVMTKALSNTAVDGLFGDDEDLNYALLTAVTQNDYYATEQLIQAGANPNCVDEHIRSPAHYAAKSGSVEMMALLYDQGGEMEMCDMVGRTPLHICGIFGSESVSEFLLSCAVVCDAVDHSGNTALHLSARGGHVSIVNLLLKFGASTKRQNMEGLSALECAQLMHPQTSELIAVVAALRGKRPTAPAISENVNKSLSKADNSSNSVTSKSTKTKSTKKQKTKLWSVSRSKNSVSTNSEALMNKLDKVFNEVMSKLMVRLPPLSPIIGVINYIAHSDELIDFRVKLKPFIIEEGYPFPSKCSDEAETLLNSALLHHNDGASEKALVNLDSAAAKTYGRINVEMYITLCKGNVYQSCGDDEQSILTYMEGWAKAEAKNDVDWEIITINAIGILAYYNLRFDVALLCFHLVGNYRLDTYGEESVDTATAWNNEACCLYCLSKKGEARLKFESAWNTLSTIAGPEAKSTLNAWKNLEKARRSQSAGRSTGQIVVDGGVSFKRSESEGVSGRGVVKLPSLTGKISEGSRKIF